MKAKGSFSRRTCALWAAMLAVLFGVGTLLVPAATTKRLMAPYWAAKGSALPKAQNTLAPSAPPPPNPIPPPEGASWRATANCR